MSTYENHGESGPEGINLGTGSEFKICSHSCGSTHHFSLFVLSQSSATCQSGTLLLRTAITRVFCSNIRYRFAAYRQMGLLARLTVAKNCLTISPGLFPQAIRSRV